MSRPTFGLLAALTACVSIVHGQAVWASNQVNTTICQWQQPRAHVVRDTVYIDGGSLWWLPGLSDGRLGAAISDRNPLGIIYTLNFSRPFSTNENITAVFGTLPKVASGTAARNLAPNYVDGAMLGNDHEWFLYGGLLRRTNEFSDPGATNVLAYQKHQYGVEKPSFIPGFVNDDLPSGMTRYLAYGGAASAPSENKAWYFSGMRAPGFGPIYEPSGNESLMAINISSTLITLDMATQQNEIWKNETLPTEIPGRAGPELVWVPVGSQGILVALGGVVFPDFARANGRSSNEVVSRETSPTFMSTIDIYDVASGTWYRQPTSGGPGQLTRGCAVVAPARDRSSFNIYYYGGYDGLDSTGVFNDDVWVLSIPSFIWTKITSSTGSGRAGHKCFMPYPDQMFVIGGYQSLSGAAPKCLPETIRVFNLTSGTWLSRYDPARFADYGVPGAVVAKIGGSPTGGATATIPAPSGWATPSLAAVFETAYPTTKISTYYPYQSVGPNDNTNPTVPPGNNDSGGGVPSYLPPVLGVVLGLVFLTMIAVLFLLWRRRRIFRSRGGLSEAGTEDTNGHRILSWMRGHSAGDKMTTTSDGETPSSPEDLESVSATHPQSISEMMNTEVRAPVELPDTSPRPELHDTGLSHIDVMNRYSRLGAALAAHSGSLNDESQYTSSGTRQIDHASVAPSTSSIDTSAVRARHANSELAGESAAPPSAVTATGNTPRGYIPSGVSNISERDRNHLRTTSDTTVSSVASNSAPDGTAAAPTTSTPLIEEEPAVSPPTAPPPSASTAEGTDYITAKPTPPTSPTPAAGPTLRPTAAATSPTSPLRRSVFHESREDMTDPKGS